MFKDVNKFKVGDKAKGFKFDGEKYPTIGYEDDLMDGVIGEIGEVTAIGNESYTVHFENGDWWDYPNELAHLAVVEEKATFKVGDKVKFKKSSLDSGMIDASEEDVFEISHAAKDHIFLKDVPSWWGIEHFEHVKEETMNTNEEQVIKWEVGQEVWCILNGSGTVFNYTKEEYPVKVLFSSGEETSYTDCGRMRSWDKNRTLFFSEPKIEAELFPPKKAFVPTLKFGETVIAKHKTLKDREVFIICDEDEETVWSQDSMDGYLKKAWNFYNLGEEIKFS